jgi:phosphoenolpyruvate-protein phosphotransferase (PTS system enzyme I)
VNTQEIILKGNPICRGVAIGTPLFFSYIEDAVAEYSIQKHEVDKEIKRYHDAIQKSREEIKFLQNRLEQQNIKEGVSILEAQLQMMQDPLLTSNVEKETKKTLKNAESILHALVEQCQKRFEALTDPFFRERFKDIQDVSRRIMTNLRAKKRVSLANIPPNSVVFSRELNASDTAEANIGGVSAFVTELGGATSHAAIVAKARGTPYVSSVSFEELGLMQHSLAIVDGRTGEIILNPSEDTLARYQDVRTQLNSHMQKLAHVGPLKAETLDGYEVRLSANIEMASELDLLRQHGGHGVGLYRSEYIFLNKNGFPNEEEQFEIYHILVKKAQGMPVVIRTFDVGGDKMLPNQQMTYEGNPFLGCRAIRFLLKEREIFKQQLRAILRASVQGDVSVMFPMVSTLQELMDAKEVVEEAKLDLQKRGLPYGAIRIGCMIEVPSAAIIADMLAKECDFLSIGTNDLVQYALAVDRCNHAMSDLYKPTHPSVLRLIKLVIHEASHQGIPVTICGEVASDPRFTPLLLGLGVHELSVATRYIPTIKHAIRSTSIVAASQLAEAVLSLRTAAEIQALLDEEYKNNVPDDCFYNY